MNGLVKSLYAGVVVSAAILSASIPARAADTEQPPAMQDVPELVVSAPATGGWYLRGDLGASWSRVRRVDFADTDSYSGGGYRGSFQFGGGAGYQVTDYFRTDLTMDYLTRGKFDGDGIVGDAKYSALSILANAYVDLGNFKGFTPYVGAGLGGTYVDWSDVSTPAGDRDGAANWRFTYALMAGVSVDLTQSLKLDAGYRYRHVNGGRMFEGDGYSGDGRDRGLNIHDLRIGLRYAFGG
ncbi:MAG: porin family protein [Rhizobiales bacterium]|nr:porin family protein [Hyphomicrobiales bacterium]OJY03721.1 MAG: porin [Rhizobiales bacterium 63-22]